MLLRRGQLLKASAVTKVAEEKTALAAYEVDREKKADSVDKADAKRTAAKQADEAAKANAAERLNAEMRAELRVN